MKCNDLNAIITGIVHRYIEDGWVLEMDNASYSDVVGVHFLSRGRERVAVGIRRPELKEVTESGRYANLRGLDSRILFESRAPKGSFATGCSFLDIAEVVDRSVAQVSKEIYDTWCKDYYIGCVDNICKLAFDGYLVREQGLDEDGVEPGEVIVLEEYMDGETQELRSLGTSDVHGV